jgi:hypothetical protein
LPKKGSRSDNSVRIVIGVSCVLPEAEVFPEAHRKRTRVVGLFPGEELLLRLVTGVLIEISETWETGKTCLIPVHRNQNEKTKPTTFGKSHQPFLQKKCHP